MKGKLNIIFVAEQRGGFDALLPVIKKIQHDKMWKAYLFLDNKNIYGFAKQQRIECSLLIDASLKKIEGIIKKIHPDIIVTDTNDTDFDGSMDKKFLKTAREFNTPTINIVDSWVNYVGRFGARLQHLPNAILAIDQKMKDDLTAMGIPENMIEVTGSPRFDAFSNSKKIKEKRNTAVFYSQPFFGKKFKEVQVFKDMVDVIEKTYPSKKIIIKFHPTREENKKDRKKYDAIIKNSTLKIKKARKDVKAEDLTKKARLVMGINSIALVDAALMGKKVISYQPGMHKKSDGLMSNANGWSLPVYSKEKLSFALQDIFKKTLVPKSELEKYTKNNSTGKVIEFIHKTLQSKNI